MVYPGLGGSSMLQFFKHKGGVLMLFTWTSRLKLTSSRLKNLIRHVVNNSNITQ